MTQIVRVSRERRLGEPEGRIRHSYWCPGCQTIHGIYIRDTDAGQTFGWDFDGNLDAPTYSPSQLSYWITRDGDRDIENLCHTFIRDGMIQFLADCTHGLRGQTVPMSPLPDFLLGGPDRFALGQISFARSPSEN